MTSSPAGDATLFGSWNVRGRSIPFDRPLVVGILNVTPDSFSDGGKFLSPDLALAHATRMVAEGADLVDIGGESTRPQGAVPVDEEEEMRRVLPVVRALHASLPSLPISVDTVKSRVAAAALDAGAAVINDVSAGRLDPRLTAICAERDAGVILMHSRGSVSEMATFTHAHYGDVVADVAGELRESVAAARENGVTAGAIVVDPGIGFAKRSEDSLAVLARLQEIVAIGFPVMVGASRKRFIGELSGVRDPAERVMGTVGVHVAALERGARLFRVHDVAAHRQALDAAWAVMRASAIAALEPGAAS